MRPSLSFNNLLFPLFEHIDAGSFLNSANLVYPVGETSY